MAKTTRRRNASDVQIRGFFRVRIVEDGDRIVGESDWFENTVTNLGKRDYLIAGLTGAANNIARMCIGTGGAPAVTDTALAGELSHQTHTASGTRNRPAVTVSTGGTLGSTAVDFYATFASSMSFCLTATNISNIAIINSTTAGGTIMAGTVYSGGSSLLNTNQDVQASYRLTFT
jgi:hypothetical protein